MKQRMDPVFPCVEAPANRVPPLQLPQELLLGVMEHLLPRPGTGPSILPASHVATRTLVALTRVGRATSEPARRLLRRHCFYLDSPRRAEAFLRYHHHDGLDADGTPAVYLEGLDGAGDYDARLVRSVVGAVAGSLRRVVLVGADPEDQSMWAALARCPQLEIRGSELLVAVEPGSALWHGWAAWPGRMSWEALSAWVGVGPGRGLRGLTWHWNGGVAECRDGRRWETLITAGPATLSGVRAPGP
ncbi:hypothetical protein ISF_03751 [Cordyceps fumosorosea ARSEF 2679]|uniref:Uncharacterized protein n=1 Tax=Cordyceps fumosorosea (strain ARSEF 2679) TaxID=1081104 RepID=A0A167ZJ08_CORFA|nr:hypothetical protein ISF_03751 [Cordyceps fumosorosea ARSEF 2679]OAA67575.1 hypothetical protein ISF_03751 [Cordyceps fumosorosea ARSEF 2679]